MMAPKNPKDKEQIGRVGEAGLFLVSDRTLSWEGRAFRDEIRSQRASDWDRSGQAIPGPRGGLRRRNSKSEFDASNRSSQLLASAVDRTAFPSAPTTRSKSRLHSRQANVCRSKWSA